MHACMLLSIKEAQCIETNLVTPAPRDNIVVYQSQLVQL